MVLQRANVTDTLVTIFNLIIVIVLKVNDNNRYNFWSHVYPYEKYVS